MHSSSRCRERFHALARLALLSCNFLSGQAQRGRGAGPKGHSSEVVKARKVHPREKLASEWRQVVTRRWRSSLPLPQTHAEDVGSGAALTTSGTLCIPKGLTGLGGLGRGRGRARRRGSAQGRRLCARGRSPRPPRVPQLLCRCSRGTSLRGYRPPPRPLAPRAHVSARPARIPRVAQRVPALRRCLGSPVPNADSARVPGGSWRTRPGASKGSGFCIWAQRAGGGATRRPR